MFLVELVMQGVRGFKDLTRLRFQNGFNIVTAGNESGKTASTDSLVRLLFPKGESGLIELLVSRLTPEASRGALVICSDDGTYYRVIQDFSKKGVNLSKYNPATKEFILVHKDWESAEQFISGMTASMSEQDFAKIFIMNREHYSVQPAPAASPAPAPAKPHAPARSRSSAAEARLAELRETLRNAEEAGNVEYQLQSTKIKLEDMAKRIADIEEMNYKYSDLESKVAELKGCEKLPENFAEIARDYEKKQELKMAKLDELRQEIENINMHIDGLRIAPVWTDTLFLIGAFAGIASFAAGLFILTAEQADYFPIGVLVSIGMISAAWYKNSRKNAQKKILRKQAQEFEAEAAEVEKGFAGGSGPIGAWMKETGSSYISELRDKVSNYKHLRNLLDDAYGERERLLGGKTIEALIEEHNRQQQAVIDLEKSAREVSQYAVDTYSIRQEIERLEAESAGASADFSAWGGEETFSDLGATAAAQTAQGLLMDELAIASRVGGIEMDTLMPAVQSATQRNFTSATQGKYVRVDMGADGELAVYDNADARSSYSDLSHGTRDLLYFCLRAGLVEAVAGKLRLPFILDDPLTGFDPARQRAASQVLRTLGAKTQVILFTSNTALRAEGDAAADLK